MKKEHKQLTKNFNSKEFDSPDLEYSGLDIDFNLVLILQKIRDEIKKPIKINSGVRTVEHNKKIGGSIVSSHVRGKAVDIHVYDSYFRFQLIELALFFGIKRIGIYKTFVHLDIDLSKPQNVIWSI